MGVMEVHHDCRFTGRSLFTVTFQALKVNSAENTILGPSFHIEEKNNL